MQDAVAVESRRPPRSLIISPNLEALLEHEDRIRQLIDDTAAVQGDPETRAADADVAEGLPPPPRKARRTRGVTKLSSPQLPRFSSMEMFHDIRKTTSLPSSPAMSTSPTTPNPYINPAPTLDDILRAEGKDVANRRGPSTTGKDALGRYQSWRGIHDSNDEDDRSWTVTRPRDDELLTTLPRPPTDARQTQTEDLEHRKHRKHISQQSVTKPPSLPRVEKLLGINRNPLSRLTDGPTQVARIEQLADDSNIQSNPSSPTSPRESPSPRSAHGEPTRNRNRGKLVKRHDSNSKSPSDKMKHVERESVVLDIRRQDTAEEGEWAELTSVPTVDVPWPRRPLLSHAAPSSSRSSSGSLDFRSDTTHEPTSTEGHDPHISISSSIYPPSSAISHPISMYTSRNSPPSSPRHSFDNRPQDRQSFIDIFSPSAPTFKDHQDPANAPDHRPKLAVETVTVASNVMSRERTRSPKPPIPTTPKPIFNRKPGGSRRSSPKEHSPARSSDNYTGIRDALPPTTNFLDLDERAELIKKSRKLTQVFGQTPGPEALALQDCGKWCGSFSGKLKHHRGAMSVSNDLIKPVLPPLRHGILSAERDLQLASITGRRHSLPLSPDEMSFLNVTPPPIDPKTPSTFERQQSSTRDIHSNDRARHHAMYSVDAGSRTSFIDLSDEETVDDGASVLITPKKTGIRRPISPSTQSLFENMTPEEQAEEERRRKREKLAKLHRFLGSRVPATLVLGIEDPDSSLPPIRSVEQTMDTTTSSDDTARKAWLRRRRSSSAAVFPTSWADDIDRMKAELNDKEKAINVRRAQKMEKVFGVAPPQTLYHTRHSPSPSAANKTAVSGVNTAMQDVLGPSIQRNPNKSSYTKTKSKKNDRPGTAESSKALLPKDSFKQLSFDSADPQRAVQHSFIYNHYQHSLNSLNDILDRDDRESLAELHQYLSNSDITTPVADRVPGERRVSNASVKSERRRSLPARTSMISIASEFSIISPKPEITDFQIRRRRAAKLTQFFGVDYRELISDVLESIENGLEHERRRGTLRAEEVDDLLARLRDLRIKREGIF